MPIIADVADTGSTFADLTTEVYLRGFDYLNQDDQGRNRVKRWINQAMHEVNGAEQWDYLVGTATGTAPLVITDLGEVESVIVNGVTLQQSDRREIAGVTGNIIASGQPYMYYKTGADTIATYPTDGQTVTVTYYRYDADLTDDVDTPLIPSRFRHVLVELACARAYRDDDNQAMAAECLADAARIIDSMRQSLLLQPDHVGYTGSGFDD